MNSVIASICMAGGVSCQPVILPTDSCSPLAMMSAVVEYIEEHPSFEVVGMVSCRPNRTAGR